MERDVLYFGIGFLVIAIFGLKLELLIEDSSFKVVLYISSVAFVVGCAFHFTAEASESAVGALLAPLPTLIYFRLLRRLFLRLVKREPIDTAMNWTPGLEKDRIFALTFIFGAMAMLFVAIIALERLAKAGW